LGHTNVRTPTPLSLGEMANPLDKLVLVSAIAPYLPTSFLGRQGPSPLASLRGTKLRGTKSPDSVALQVPLWL